MFCKGETLSILNGICSFFLSLAITVPFKCSFVFILVLPSLQRWFFLMSVENCPSASTGWQLMSCLYATRALNSWSFLCYFTCAQITHLLLWLCGGCCVSLHLHILKYLLKRGMSWLNFTVACLALPWANLRGLQVKMLSSLPQYSPLSHDMTVTWPTMKHTWHVKLT